MSKGFKSPGKMTKRVPEMLAKLLEKMKLASSIGGQQWRLCGVARNGVKFFLRDHSYTLITQPMLQRRRNPMKLRSMDSYIQILCRFQKSKKEVPPPSPLSNEKSPLTPPKEIFSHPLGE